jgi:hypothetical protein
MGARERKAEALALGASSVPDRARVVRVVGFQGGEVRVQVDGASAPVVARVSAAIDDEGLRAAARHHQEAVVVFAEGEPAVPIVLALLRSRTPLVDALLTEPLPPAERTARLDGERVVLEAKEEVVLRCGKASLTLRRDGKVVLRGVNVVTRADQVQKIRGGKVQIN